MKTRISPPISGPRHGRESEAGSAYLVALLSLVVLTMLALALTFTTQTELLVGSNERVLQRAFYAAESAAHLAVAHTLKDHDKCAQLLEFSDVPAGKPGWLLKARIEYDPIYPVAAPWCNLCTTNDADEYSTNAFFKVNHAITARGFLVSGGGDVGARKTITDMVDIHPWQDAAPPLSCAPLAATK